MNLWIRILLGVVLLLVLLHVLGALFGLLFWLAVIVGAVVIVAALVNPRTREERLLKPMGRMAQRRVEKQAKRALKDLERKVKGE